MIYSRHEYRDLCLVYAVIQTGRFSTKWGKLQELQITCTSQRLLAKFESLIFEESRALLAGVEWKVKF